MKILLFEDDHVHFANLQQRFSSLELKELALRRVESLPDLREELDSANCSYDFALIDLFHGPGGETRGFDAFEIIEELCPDLPAFFYTSHARMEFVAKAKSLGASGFIDRMELHSQPELLLRMQQQAGTETESLPFLVSPKLKESLFDEFLIRETQNTSSHSQKLDKKQVQLSEVEKEFLGLYCQGYSRSEILHRLNLGSKQDYQSLLPALYGKLGLSAFIPTERMKAIGPYLAAAVAYGALPFPYPEKES